MGRVAREEGRGISRGGKDPVAFEGGSRIRYGEW